MTSRSLYLDGKYLLKNPAWHVEESAWKAKEILRMLRRNHVSPSTVCEVGCGAGEVLAQLQQKLGSEPTFCGFDVSPQAIELAKSRANEKLHFCLSDLSDVKGSYFELVLVLDVIEHLQDYFRFLCELRDKGRYKIFHIPLDLSVQTVLRKHALLKRRDMYGHLHFFTKETALEVLRDTGYEILDWFYTPRANCVGAAATQRLLKLPRKLLFAFHEDVAARVLGGYSLLVLAR
jgi:cyclopropane fatty-acyl-phospholipid synthase-like methyltransferase